MLQRVLLLAACAIPALAWGQASPQAEALFRDGKRLMKDGRIADACTAFEASERAEHNIATVLSAADCREKNKQYASAWALFLAAESQTRSDPTKQTLNATARTRASALEGKLSYLTIEVPDALRVPELVITRDGVALDSAEWNRALPADGGGHLIVAKAPGHESWTGSIQVGAEGDKQAIRIGKLKALPKPKPVAGAHAAPPPPNPFTKRRKIAIGIAGGAVAAAGVGIGFGLDARSLRDQALATCPASACGVGDAAAAQATNDKARRRALIANVGFGVAGGAAIAAGVLWFLSPPERRTRMAIVPAANGFAVAGSF
jgi:hypothetical protein